jgi:hypothetical protein
MSLLKTPIELIETLRSYQDVERAFRDRGYKVNIDMLPDRQWIIKASVVNLHNETIGYEFTSQSQQDVYQQAALFLLSVQTLRKSYDLRI